MKIVRWQIFFILAILAFVSAAQADFKNEEDNQSLQSRVSSGIDTLKNYGRQIFYSGVIFFVGFYCIFNLLWWGLMVLPFVIPLLIIGVTVSEQPNNFFY